MFPLILTALLGIGIGYKDPFKDCSSKGEHPEIQPQPRLEKIC